MLRANVHRHHCLLSHFSRQLSPETNGNLSVDASDAATSAAEGSVSERRVQRYAIANVPVDAVSMAEALDRICALARARRGGTVFTPNVDHVMLAQRMPEFAAAYAETDLALIDGMALLWSARLLGLPIRHKVSGSDLLWPLLEMGATRGLSVYLLGGAPKSAEMAREVLVKRLPKLRVVGVDAPRIDLDTPSSIESEKVLNLIQTARPDLLVVGLGAPKQEIWLHRNRRHLGSIVGLGLGACIDFLAGKVHRAPVWISRSGFEWLYRLLQEPRRLAHRYLIRDAGFPVVLLNELVRRR